MALRKFSKKRRNVPKRRFAKRRPLRAKRPALKKLIRREIARNVENKNAQYYNYNTNLYALGNVSFTTDNIFPLTLGGGLQVTQGVGQGQRIGNSIKTKRFMFKGTITLQPYDTTFNNAPLPLQFKMWIFYDKTQPTETPNPIAANDWFQDGSTVKGFQNDLVDMWTPVNSDRYRVLATRNFKIGFSNYGGTGSSATNQSYTNNDFKLNGNFSVNLTSLYPKAVKFNDTTGVPTTRSLFCMIMYVASNGNPIATTQLMARVQYMMDYDYEDA